MNSKVLRLIRFCGAMAGLAFAGMVSAQTPPAGALWDLNNHFTGALTSYTQFSTSFVADNANMDVSFAFREEPAYFAFDNASVTQNGSTTNLLADPGFESASYGQNCNHNNSLGCPAGWNAWIQPIDTSAIGQIATNSARYGCNVNSYAGSNMWCDGSVQGYDAIYQSLSGLTVGATYNISFWLEDDSGQAITYPTIDMLVYAGDTIPGGTTSLCGGPNQPPCGSTGGGGTNVPEPATLALLGLGLAGIGFMRRRKIS